MRCAGSTESGLAWVIEGERDEARQGGLKPVAAERRRFPRGARMLAEQRMDQHATADGFQDGHAIGGVPEQPITCGLVEGRDVELEVGVDHPASVGAVEIGKLRRLEVDPQTGDAVGRGEIGVDVACVGHELIVNGPLAAHSGQDRISQCVEQQAFFVGIASVQDISADLSGFGDAVEMEACPAEFGVRLPGGAQDPRVDIGITPPPGAGPTATGRRCGRGVVARVVVPRLLTSESRQEQAIPSQNRREQATSGENAIRTLLPTYCVGNKVSLSTSPRVP